MPVFCYFCRNNVPRTEKTQRMKSLPQSFTQRMKQVLGAEYESFLAALSLPPPVSIRLHPQKSKQSSELPWNTLSEIPVPWCPEAYYLKERPLFTLDPLLHAGAYYAQEAASMFLRAAIRQIAPQRAIRALDLCAAPGGKSTLLISALPPGSLLVANEVIRSRAAILKENLIKWGSGHTVVTQADPAQFSALPETFDLLLVDAPCSGEGMFRKDPAAISEWSENNLRLCQERQRRILADAWHTLAPGGYLIYSTCTYNPGENEEIVEWLAGQYPATPLPIAHDHPGITPGYSHLPCYRFYPHRTAGEGFFIALLRKEESGERHTLRKEREKSAGTVAVPAPFLPYLTESAAWEGYLAGETFGIVPVEHAAFIRQLMKKTGALYRGCELGEPIKNKIRPAHALSLFTGLNRQAAPFCEVDRETAIRFLRKEELPGEGFGNIAAGEWALPSYCGLPLGWVKSVGNRLNNYYPKEWRIRMNQPE